MDELLSCLLTVIVLKLETDLITLNSLIKLRFCIDNRVVDFYYRPALNSVGRFCFNLIWSFTDINAL